MEASATENQTIDALARAASGHATALLRSQKHHLSCILSPASYYTRNAVCRFGVSQPADRELAPGYTRSATRRGPPVTEPDRAALGCGDRGRSALVELAYSALLDLAFATALLGQRARRAFGEG
jgi:hypothetical protein